jgi:5-methylcytosine-specific restriction endonuclease McrA
MTTRFVQQRCSCGNMCVSKGRDARGRQTFSKKCQTCRKNKYGTNKASSCAVCGFLAEHPCQMDIDHIDGNHDNNDVTNLQTLCANCHRLKTIMCRDHVPVITVKVLARSLFE